MEGGTYENKIGDNFFFFLLDSKVERRRGFSGFTFFSEASGFALLKSPPAQYRTPSKK